MHIVKQGNSIIVDDQVRILLCETTYILFSGKTLTLKDDILSDLHDSVKLTKKHLKPEYVELYKTYKVLKRTIPLLGDLDIIIDDQKTVVKTLIEVCYSTNSVSGLKTLLFN